MGWCVGGRCQPVNWRDLEQREQALWDRSCRGDRRRSRGVFDCLAPGLRRYQGRPDRTLGDRGREPWGNRRRVPAPGSRSARVSARLSRDRTLANPSRRISAPISNTAGEVMPPLPNGPKTCPSLRHRSAPNNWLGSTYASFRGPIYAISFPVFRPISWPPRIRPATVTPTRR